VTYTSLCEWIQQFVGVVINGFCQQITFSVFSECSFFLNSDQVQQSYQTLSIDSASFYLPKLPLVFCVYAVWADKLKIIIQCALYQTVNSMILLHEPVM